MPGPGLWLNPGLGPDSAQSLLHCAIMGVSGIKGKKSDKGSARKKSPGF